MRSRRGQLALFAVLALGLVVVAVVYAMLSGRRAETRSRAQQTASEDARRELEKAQAAVGGFLEAAVHRAAEEMASHGGFTKENVPPLNHFGAPYWYYEGKVVNVPTVQVMEQMLSQEVERTVKERTKELSKTLRRDVYSFGFPRVNVTLLDPSIRATMSLPIRVKTETEDVSTDVQFTSEVPLRLKLLRDLAAFYVANYTNARTMEDSIFDSITHDPRIPKPGGDCCAPLPSCEGRHMISSVPGYPCAERQFLTEHFREHAQLAVANEMRRVRRADFGPALKGSMDASSSMEFLEWSFDLYSNEFRFSFVANEGHPEYLDTDTVYFYRIGPFGLSPDGECMGGYEMNYSIHFPVKIILRDLLPTSKVVGAVGSAELKPLELMFYMEPYLQKESPATNGSVTAPAFISDPCMGSCALTVDLDPPTVGGTLAVDGCRYPSTSSPLTYTSGTAWRNVPCGVHDVTFEAEGTGYARSGTQANIGSSSRLSLAVLRFGSLSGRAVMNDTVYCTASQTVKVLDPVPLGYVDGRPPAYVELFLFPLDTALGDVLDAKTDEEGRYAFPTVNPGKYLLLAVSSKDTSDRPLYKVLPRGRIVSVAQDAQELEVVMSPLGVERDKLGTYHRVASREEC